MPPSILTSIITKSASRSSPGIRIVLFAVETALTDESESESFTGQKKFSHEKRIKTGNIKNVFLINLFIINSLQVLLSTSLIFINFFMLCHYNRRNRDADINLVSFFMMIFKICVFFYIFFQILLTSI